MPIPLFERLQIESQSNCNRTCWFCPRTYDRTGVYLDGDGRSVLRRMPTDKILDLLDQAAAMGFHGRVSFYHYSEPTLDERCLLLGREARARGMAPYLHTNGDVLRRDDELCREIQTVYHPIVVGLYDYQSKEELEADMRWWRLRLSDTVPSFVPIGDAGSGEADSVAVPRVDVPKDSRMSRPDLRYTNAPCHRPLIRMLVRYDGEMCLCCEDTRASFALGSVYERSMEELWFSRRHEEIVEELIEGHREHHPLCRNCPMPPTALPAAGAKVGFARR